MKSLINTKIVIGVIALIFFGIIGYLFSSFNDASDNITHSNEISETTGITQVTIPKVNAPEGWEVYMGNESKWQRGDVRTAFAYPPEWTMSEEIIEQKLRSVTVAGDGYSFRIDQAGRGMPRPYDYTQVIGGYSARVWESVTDSGKQFTFGITDIDFVIHVATPSDSKEYLDQIISSMLFYK